MKPYAATKTGEWRRDNPNRRARGHREPRRIGDRGAKGPVRQGSRLRNLGAIAFAMLLAGCAHVPPAPAGALPAAGLQRLYCVDHPACTVLRSEQPSRAQFAELVRAYGIKSVIKLNTWLPGDGDGDDVPDGVVVFHHQWAPAGPVTHEQIVDTLNDLEHAPRPVLVHCSHGIDRTGLLIAMWRVLHDVLPFAAWGEWRAYGRDMALLLLSERFFEETGWSP